MTSERARESAPTTPARLDSWKQIAAYLNRDVRTVQRWEKSEGLPVHRHQHGSRGTVFAHPAEVDRWLEGRSTGGEAVPVEPAPRGPTPTPPPFDPPGSPRPAAVPRPRRAVALALLALLAVVALWQQGEDAGSGGVPSGAAVARLLVLPFTGIAADPLEETTGRALHEQLITELARLDPGRLTVIGRTSALRSEAAGLDAEALGETLGVDHVLEGAVRLREGELQVTARLVRAAGQGVVWSEDFSLDATDLPREEERVVGAVCARLGKRLLGLERAPSKDGGEDPEARASWLRGRYLWHKGTREGFRASLPHFEAALARDPLFVDAHVGLANAYALLGRYGAMPAHEAFPKARRAAARALELAPDSAEAHAALALVHFYYAWDFEAAAREFATALRLGPGLALTHHAYAHFLSCLGLHEEGLASAQRARALEPLWPLVLVDTAWFHYRARDYEEAAAESRRALQLEPGMSGAVECLVQSLEKLGDAEQAWEVLRAHLEAEALLAEVPGLEGADAAGSLAAVRRWKRAEIEALAQERFIPAHTLVFSLTDLGREDDVLIELAKAIKQRDRVALLTRVHPAFDGLRDEPRFQALVAEVGFPDDATALIAP